MTMNGFYNTESLISLWDSVEQVETLPHVDQFLQALRAIFQANNFGLQKPYQSPSFFIKDVDLPAAILLR